MEEKFLAGKYGDYELVFASEEAIDAYAESCLASISEDEMYEAWQLYHISVSDLLEKVFSCVRVGKGEAYFLLYHNSDEEEAEVLGIGGIGDVPELAEWGKNVGEIWFMGQSLVPHKRFLVQYGRKIVAKVLTKYSVLLNMAAAWNSSAFSLVKFLGFTVGKNAIPAGRDKSLYKYFYITK